MKDFLIGKNIQITIDGPAAAGKGTVAKKLASTLGVVCLDTGALFRGITIHFMREAVDIADAVSVAAALSSLDMDIKPEDGTTRIILGGEDITMRLHDIDVCDYVHQVAKVSAVREITRSIQHKIGHSKTIVCEGRDIGTVVFPKARFKFYLDAKAEARATRRHKMEVEAGEDTTYEEVLRMIKERDHNDMTREISPLKKAKGAHVVDASDISADQAAQQMYDVIRTALMTKVERNIEKARATMKPKRRMHFRFFMKTLLWLPTRLIFPTRRYNKHYLKQLKGQPFILAANHVSNYDVPCMFLNIPRKLNFVGKEALFGKTISRKFFMGLGAYPVGRDNSLAVVRFSLDSLKVGNVVMIFPEGRRRFNSDEAMALRNGASMMALKGKVPILPVVISRAPKPFVLTKLKFGKPIMPEEFAVDKITKDAMNSLSDRMSNTLQGMLENFEHKPRRKAWDNEPVANAKGIVIRYENDDPYLLVIKRNRPSYNDGADYYTLPGGHTEDGETPYEAAVREVMEETGIETQSIRIMYKYRFKGQMQAFLTLEHKGGKLTQNPKSEEYAEGVADTIARDGQPRGTFEPMWVKLSRIHEADFDLKPVAVKNQISADIKKLGVKMVRDTMFIKRKTRPLQRQKL